ncbi:MAG: sulfite exporter TauE/SafE family protein [Gammaproteobacteria bacterium]|nr:MAG: sulfite exporter TauE/SafE family protein [Gammaproteobacteria bacterium]
MLLIIFIYLALGCFVGILAGVFGVGGGIIIVPVLFFAFRKMGMDESVITHMAIATSHAAIIFTSSSSSYVMNKSGNVQWNVVRSLAPGMLLGGLLIGPNVADFLPSSTLQIIFAIFMVIVAIKMWFGLKPKTEGALPSASVMATVGIGIGSVSSILGIGGGSLTVPFLTWKGLGIRTAVGSSVSSAIVIAVSSSIGYIYTGIGESGLPEETMGYIYWPALLGIVATSMLFVRAGVKIAALMDEKLQKKLFSVLLIIVAGKMLLS